MEEIQERATKITYRFSGLEYKEKLILTTLKDKRIKEEIIEMYKIVKEHKGVDASECANPSRLRSDLELDGPTRKSKENQFKGVF